MRILQVIGAIAPEFGGSSTSCLGLNAGLNAVPGVSATIYSTNFGSPRHPGQRITSADLPAGARVRLFRASRPFFLYGSWRLAAGLLRDVRRYDAVHIEGLYSLPVIFAYLACRLWRRPFGLHPHGNFDPYQLSQSRRKKAPFDLLFTRGMVKRASWVAFGSSVEAQAARDLVPAAVSLVCPLGASLEEPGAIESSGAQADVDERAVLYLGRFARKKRVVDLIEAWALLPSATRTQLVVAGTDEHWNADDLRELAVARGVGDSVLLLGPVVGAQKTLLMRRCPVFCLPSESENFGIAVAEAMLGSCYVVTTTEVAASEHVLRAQAGVVITDYSIKRLAAEIKLALERPADTRATGNRGSEYADAHLGWDRAGRVLSDAAAQACSRGRERAL